MLDSTSGESVGKHIFLTEGWACQKANNFIKIYVCDFDLEVPVLRMNPENTLLKIQIHIYQEGLFVIEKY